MMYQSKHGCVPATDKSGKLTRGEGRRMGIRESRSGLDGSESGTEDLFVPMWAYLSIVCEILVIQMGGLLMRMLKRKGNIDVGK